MKNLKDKKIIFVFGKLCSGKGSFCKTTYPNVPVISTSSIVRNVSGKNKRSELTKTSHLDTQIATEMISTIKQHNVVVIEGIRQKSIVQQVCIALPDYSTQFIWLEVSMDTLKQRFYDRNHTKDDSSFEKSIELDDNLGMKELEKWIKQQPETVIINGA